MHKVCIGILKLNASSLYWPLCMYASHECFKIARYVVSYKKASKWKSTSKQNTNWFVAWQTIHHRLHSVLDHYRPSSETPFKWRFAGGSIVVLIVFLLGGAQWLSGRCLTWGWGAAGLGLTGVTTLLSLSKTHFSLLSTGSTQEDPSLFYWKIVDGT